MSDLYKQILLEGENEDFTDLLSYGVIYQVGFSKDLPVVVFFPYYCPDYAQTTNRIWLYVVHLLDKITNIPYIMIYISNGVDYEQNQLLYEKINQLKEICPQRYYLNLNELYILGRNKKFKQNQLCSKHNITKVTQYLKSPNYLSSLFPLFNLEFPEWLYEPDNSNSDNTNSSNGNYCCCCSANVVYNLPTNSKESEIEERRESRYLIDLDRYYNQHKDLPEYIKDIFEYLNRDEKIVGLLRIPGQCTTINTIIKMILFEKKRLKDITDIKYNSYDITGVMKKILNKLSEPIIPCSYFNEIVSIKVDDRNNMNTVNEIINLWNRILDNLCKSKIELMKLLFNFLDQVNRNSEVNHMGSENISVILTMGGFIIRSENSLDDIKYFENICLFFKVFLDNFEEFEVLQMNNNNNKDSFPIPSPVLPSPTPSPSPPSSASSIIKRSLHRTRSSNTKLNLTRSVKRNESSRSIRVYDVLDENMKEMLNDNKLNENESVILRSGNLSVGDILPPSNNHLLKSNEDKCEMKLESVINEDLNEEMKSAKTTPRDDGEGKESNT